MTGYYELKKAGTTGFMFNLKAGNHETILTSQTYTAKDGAKKGIASLCIGGGEATAVAVELA